MDDGDYDDGGDFPSDSDEKAPEAPPAEDVPGEKSPGDDTPGTVDRTSSRSDLSVQYNDAFYIDQDGSIVGVTHLGHSAESDDRSSKTKLIDNPRDYRDDGFVPSTTGERTSGPAQTTIGPASILRLDRPQWRHLKDLRLGLASHRGSAGR